jgi:glucokinase
MDYIIGLDLGGTTVKIGLVNSKGQIQDMMEIPTLAETNSVDAIFKNIVHGINELIKKHSNHNIKAIGIGSPGSISPEQGKIVAGIGNIPALNGFALGVEIENEFKIPTFIDNDANNAARGEYLFGNAKGRKNFIMITLGTGIGGAIFINGELYGGALNYAGEVGHMLIVVDGKQCTCGNFGCWEAYGSATAMVKKAKAMVERGYGTSLISYYPDEISAKTIVKEAHDGDEIAQYVVEEAGKYIGIGIANMLNIFNPEACIIGGGVSQAGDFLLNVIKHYTKVYALPRAWECVEIFQAKLGNKAGILGSAALAYMKIEEGK